MSGLFGSLQIGVRSLANLQTAMAVTSENLANSQTPGYSRKRIVYQDTVGDVRSFGVLGRGAEIRDIQSLRDNFINKRILVELQSRGTLAGQQFGLEQVEGILHQSGQSEISEQISRFFNSFLELSADPSSSQLRQAVMAEGETLASLFRSSYEKISSIRVENQAQLGDAVTRVNFLLDRIAEVNEQLTPLLAKGTDGSNLFDQRQELMNQLAEEMGFSSYQTESGLQMITTPSGKLLLSGTETFKLSIQDTSSGRRVYLNNQDITSELKTGKLGGYWQLDQQTLPSYLNALDALAEELASNVNALHRSGQGLDGSSGLDFFQFTSGQAASSLSVAVTDSNALAAAQLGGGPGDGRNAQLIADLRDQKFSTLGNDTFTGYFSQIVFEAGLNARQVRDALASQNRIVSQLEQQRESVSGISLDEEAANLLQFQRAYQANTRFLRVVDSLLEETLNLLR